MQTIAETCVCFDAVHLSINLVSEIAAPMFPTLIYSVSIKTYPACLTGNRLHSLLAYIAMEVCSHTSICW